MNYLFIRPELKKDNKVMLAAIPFNGDKGLDPKKIPRTKAEILEYSRRGTKPGLQPKNETGYYQLNVKKWMESDEMYEPVLSKKTFAEPYYLINRHIQLYDETFIAWGHDKVTQVYDMRAAGYKLKVLPDAYMVHLNHSDIKNYRKWNAKFNNGPRNRIKVGTAVNRRTALPGLFANTYYPEWLGDGIFCPKEKFDQISMINEEIILTEIYISDYKKLLTMMVVVLVSIIIFISFRIVFDGAHKDKSKTK